MIFLARRYTEVLTERNRLRRRVEALEVALEIATSSLVFRLAALLSMQMPCRLCGEALAHATGCHVMAALREVAQLVTNWDSELQDQS